jgi:hypothetical protein
MKKVLILVVSTYFCEFIFGQDPRLIDSLENRIKNLKFEKSKITGHIPVLFDSSEAVTFYRLSKAFWNTDPVRSDTYAKTCLSLSERIGFDRGLALGNNSLGVISWNKGEYVQAGHFL